MSEFPDNSCFPVLLFWKYLPELRHKPFFQLDESGCFVSPALSRLADTAEVLGSTKSLKVLFLSLRIFIKFFYFFVFHRQSIQTVSRLLWIQTINIRFQALLHRIWTRTSLFQVTTLLLHLTRLCSFQDPLSLEWDSRSHR